MASKKTKVWIMIEDESLEWLERHYPRTSKSWIFNRMLRYFIKVNTITPDDYARIGARELKRLLEK